MAVFDEHVDSGGIEELCPPSQISKLATAVELDSLEAVICDCLGGLNHMTLDGCLSLPAGRRLIFAAQLFASAARFASILSRDAVIGLRTTYLLAYQPGRRPSDLAKLVIAVKFGNLDLFTIGLPSMS